MHLFTKFWRIPTSQPVGPELPTLRVGRLGVPTRGWEDYMCMLRCVGGNDMCYDMCELPLLLVQWLFSFWFSFYFMFNYINMTYKARSPPPPINNLFHRACNREQLLCPQQWELTYVVTHSIPPHVKTHSLSANEQIWAVCEQVLSDHQLACDLFAIYHCFAWHLFKPMNLWLYNHPIIISLILRNFFWPLAASFGTFCALIWYFSCLYLASVQTHDPLIM